MSEDGIENIGNFTIMGIYVPEIFLKKFYSTKRGIIRIFIDSTEKIDIAKYQSNTAIITAFFRVQS